jgi:outer membrane cobalamin receptor
MKYTFLTLVLIFISSAIWAQGGHQMNNRGEGPKEGIIKGSVKNESGGEKIAYATVSVYSVRDSSFVTGGATKDDGSFSITEMPFGRFYIVVDFIGFHKKTISDIKVTPNQKTFDCGEISLTNAEEMIETVNVVADRNQMQYKIDKKVINLSQNINAAGGTIVDALESVPSVKVDVDGNVSLRGSSNFTVLIDGKPSVLSGTDALNQIPSSAVENIEIITNPSAKYDPDGTSGIINVVMKRQQKGGFNGVVNAMIGTNEKYSGDFLLNLRTKKVNYFFSAGYGHRNNEGRRNSDRETFHNDSSEYLTTRGIGQFLHENLMVKGGADIYLNDKNSLSFSAELGENGMERNMIPKYEYSTSYNDIHQYTSGSSGFSSTGNYFTGNLDYTKNFSSKGHKILFSANYSSMPGDNTTTTTQDLTDSEWNFISPVLRNQSIQTRDAQNLRLKADYTLPISETQNLEAGYQYQNNRIQGDYSYTELNIGTNIWENDAAAANSVDFKREIQSLYATYTSRAFGLDFKAGLRTEYTNQFLNQVTTSQKYDVNRFDFFPTGSISKDFGKGRQMQAAYSRRVNRPEVWNMNPFPGPSNLYEMRIGNPGLRPEFIDSYDMSYQHTAGRQIVVLDAYYRRLTDGIERIETMGENGMTINTVDNVSKSHSIGAELSANMELARWAKVFAAVDVFYFELHSNIENVPVVLSNKNAELSLNSTFSLSKSTRFQINARYESPRVEAQEREDESYRLDFSLRQEFFNRKLSVVLKAQDPFAISTHKSVSHGVGFTTANDFRREQRVYMLTVSYKINNYKQQERREREENGGGGEGFDM